MNAPRQRPEDHHSRHIITKENVMIGLGILIAVVELVNSEILGRSFHYEFLIFAGTLFGVGVAQLGDKGK